MRLTPHQAKYLAYELTRRWSSDNVGKLAAAVAGAQVDLNPHQVDAALFAFNSPFSNGALLADEVGLGKTIEAGISGQLLDQETSQRLLTLPGEVLKAVGDAPPEILNECRQKEQARISRDISERNAGFFEAEACKLDNWSDDLKVGLEREIKDIDRQIKEARRAATAALSLEEKLAGQKQVKALESHRKERRRSLLFDAQDKIDDNRERLIEKIEVKLKSESSEEGLFTIRWGLN